MFAKIMHIFSHWRVYICRGILLLVYMDTESHEEDM